MSECSQHPGVTAETACETCQLPICADCHGATVDGGPSCLPCADSTRARSVRRAILGVVLFVLGIVLCVWSLTTPHHRHFVRRPWMSPVVIELATIFAGLGLVATSRVFDSTLVVERPWRTKASRSRPSEMSLRRVTFILLASTLGIVACFPRFLTLPIWVEIELALLGYGVALSAAIAWLLYRGIPWREDHAIEVPASPWEPVVARVSMSRVLGERGPAHMSGLSAWESGFAQASDPRILVAVIAFAFVPWLVVETVLPFAFAVFYGLTAFALRIAEDDRVSCHDRPFRALGTAAVIVTCMSVPLALVVLGIHAWAGLVSR